jgi:hypothetical protein
VPSSVRIAAVLVLLEALALIGYGALVLGALGGDAAAALSTGVFFVAYGVALLLAVRGLRQRASWARSLVVVTQLLMLGIAWNLREQPTSVVAGALAAAAVVTVAAMLSPSAAGAFED